MTSPAAAPVDAAAREQWWRSAVIYQVYIRSFADGTGDGMGDIAGLRSRLGYLRDLGVDAVWINPWYPSPMADAGYDVADYRDIEPLFGTLDEAEALIAEAHEHGLKVVLDIVPNHSSSEHPWFTEALAAGPGSPERARYIFRPGRGEHGEQPPNDWQSAFGGGAWTRVSEPDGRPGEWYLHLFDAGQPDFDWTSPDVRAEFMSVLRFWFDRGVDGFRIDVAHGLTKEPGLPDIGDDADRFLAADQHGQHPHWDRLDVQEVYEAWREVADSYDPPRMFCAEAWVASPDRLVEYVKEGRLHTAFNFDFVRAPWDAEELRSIIETSLDSHATVGAATTWVLSNHDIVRDVTRFGRPDADEGAPGGRRGGHLHAGPGPVDVELGRKRARAAALLMLALPGAAYVYQGEELGLEEVLDLPGDVRQDPAWTRSGGEQVGRDGCRVPIPWRHSGNSLGFGTDGSWLPQPAGWAQLSVEAQQGDPGSMLELYRAALRLRREHPALGDGGLHWRDLGSDVVSFARDPGFACVVNLGPEPVALPREARVLLTSGPLGQERLGDPALPVDTAVWLAV